MLSNIVTSDDSITINVSEDLETVHDAAEEDRDENFTDIGDIGVMTKIKNAMKTADDSIVPSEVDVSNYGNNFMESQVIPDEKVNLSLKLKFEANVKVEV